MKIKVDENIGRSGVNLLRQAGHDVMTVNEQALSGAADEVIFQVCASERRTLVTLDRDFGQVPRFPPKQSAGLVVLEFGRPCNGWVCYTVGCGNLWPLRQPVPLTGSFGSLKRAACACIWTKTQNSVRGRTKKSYPRPQNRPYIPRHPCWLKVAVMTRSGEPGRGRAADNAACLSAGYVHLPAGWSAGRRSGSVARPRKPRDHRPRAPRDGFRKPVLARRAGVSGVTHRRPARAP